jgi:hypothetical protein
MTLDSHIADGSGFWLRVGTYTSLKSNGVPIFLLNYQMGALAQAVGMPGNHWAPLFISESRAVAIWKKIVANKAQGGPGKKQLFRMDDDFKPGNGGGVAPLVYAMSRIVVEDDNYPVAKLAAASVDDSDAPTQANLSPKSQTSSTFTHRVQNAVRALNNYDLNPKSQNDCVGTRFVQAQKHEE